ncbi:unnamed protein product [Blepharisma stoltei]|uniref:RING-type domain-containing protein n=1 Tax=Blepharisma stoltei TaxID=1481888 RepID=A0AAU9IVI1_9CILI|nr:unnamed protein product [Blepharisma stoltei]
MDDFICPFCRKILLKPITVSCGHTFCKPCVTRSSNSQRKCPNCDSTFQVSPHSKPNILIQSLSIVELIFVDSI